MLIYLSIVISSIIGPIIGIGGALINIPLMRLMGYDLINFIIPVSIFIALITALSSSMAYVRYGLSQVKEALYIGIPMLFTSYIGSKYTGVFGKQTIEILLGIYLLMSGIRLLYFKRLKIKLIGHISHTGLVIIGAIVGFFLGLLGIIGGSIITTLFLLSGYELKAAIASGLFAALFAGTGGTLGHTLRIHMPLKQLLLYGIVAFAAARIGAYILKIWKRTRVLEVIVGIFFIFLAIRMIVGL